MVFLELLTNFHTLLNKTFSFARFAQRKRESQVPSSIAVSTESLKSLSFPNCLRKRPETRSLPASSHLDMGKYRRPANARNRSPRSPWHREHQGVGRGVKLLSFHRISSLTPYSSATLPPISLDQLLPVKWAKDIFWMGCCHLTLFQWFYGNC